MTEAEKAAADKAAAEKAEAEKAAAEKAAADKAASDKAAADKAAADKAAAEKKASDEATAKKAAAGEVSAQMELVNALREELAATREQLNTIQKAAEATAAASKEATATRMKAAALNAGLSKEAFLALAPADLLTKDPDTEAGKQALVAFRTAYPECFGQPRTAGDAARHGKQQQSSATQTGEPAPVPGIPKSWADRFADRLRIA